MKKHLLSAVVGLFSLFALNANAQTTIYTQTFNSSPADWTASASPISNFAVPTAPSPISGGNAAGKTIAGTTPVGGRTLSKTTDISTVGYTGIKVNWQGYSNTLASIASPANMTVDFSTNGGGAWTTVTFTQLTLINTWTALSATLPAAADGQATLRVRFTFKSFTNTSRYFIDDVTITGTSSATYYSKAAGSLDLLSSWTDDPTGVAGSSPANFTNNGQTFNVRNGNPGTIAANLTISGTNSKMVIESGNSFSTDAANSYTGTVDVNSGGTLNLINTSVPTIGTLGGTSTVVFGAASSQTIPVASYGNLTVDNAVHSLAGSISVPGTLTLTSDGELTIGNNNTLTISGTVSGSGSINGAASPDPTTNPSLTYTSTSNNTINFGNDANFRNLSVTNSTTSVLTLGTCLAGQVQVNNLLAWGNTNSRISLNGNGFILEGDLTGLGEFIGSATSSIAIYNTFTSAALTNALGLATSTTLSTLEIYGRNTTVNSNLTLVDLLTIDAATLTISGAVTTTIQDLLLATSGATLVPGTGRFTFNGATNKAQTIPALNYNNITISGARTTNNVTLENGGTIGVAGNYNATATFTTGNYDVTNNTVNFNGAGAMTITKSANVFCTFNNLTISSGTLTDATITGTQVGFNVKGDFVNNSTFTAHATNPVIFNGTGAQDISGVSTTSFNNINVSSTATRTLSVSSPVNLINNMSITGPGGALMLTIDLGGNLTLKSTSSAATAAITQITNPNSVTFTGNLNVERFALGGTTGWCLMGSNGLSGQTFADFDDDTYITCAACPDGYNISGTNFASVNTDTESLATTPSDPNRFAEIASIADPMDAGIGYWFYFGDGQYSTNDITLDQSGTVVKGNVAITVTKAVGNTDSTGWNLLANPYPCAIDWDLFFAGNSNLDNQVQIFNPDFNDYSTYASGVGTNGLDNNGTIPMGQAFYIHKTGSTGSSTITFAETHKSTVKTNLLRTQNPTTSSIFRLRVNGAINQDETYFAFNANATNNWDSDYDAANWYNLDPSAANISSVLNGTLYAINGLPQLASGTVSIPVLVQTGVAGTFTLSPIDLNNLPSGACVILHDNINNTDHDLRTGAYTVDISDTCTVPNFTLNITINNNIVVTPNTTQPTCVDQSNGLLTAVGDNSGPWNYYWKDANNNIIQTSMGVMGADTLFNVGQGTYSVELTTAGGCDNGSTTYNVVNPPLVLADFSAPDTIYLNNGIATAAFTDASTYANSYAWDFGDGSIIESNQNPTHDYIYSGVYSVTLTSYNTLCGDSSQFLKDILVITQPSVVGLTNNEVFNNTFITQNDGDVFVRFNYNSSTPVKLFVTDALGKQLTSIIETNAYNQSVALGLRDVPTQVLFVHLINNNQHKVIKLVKN